MMYQNPQAVVQVNKRPSRTFAIERSVRQGCPLSPLLYVLALEPLLRRLRDEGTNPALRGVPFAGPLIEENTEVMDISVNLKRRRDSGDSLIEEGEKTRMVFWTTRKKGLYDDANFSHLDLVKIRCDRKRLDRIKLDKGWVNAASLVVRKGAILESSFPPLPALGVYGTGPSGHHTE